MGYVEWGNLLKLLITIDIDNSLTTFERPPIWEIRVFFMSIRKNIGSVNPIIGGGGDANLHHPVFFHEKMIDHLGFGSRAFLTFNIFSFCTFCKNLE